MKYRFMILAIGLVITSSHLQKVEKPVFAQESSLTPIYTGEITQIMWSSNSQNLTFKSGPDTATIYLQHGSWWTYNVETQELTVSQVWPLQGIAPNSTNFSPINVDTTTYQSYIFESPNGRFIVYAGEEGIQEDRGVFRYLLTLGDTQTLDTFLIPMRLVENPFIGIEKLRVVWSEDNSTFVVVDQQLTPILNAVDNFTSDVSNVIVHRLAYKIGDESSVAQEVYDLNSDGSQILTLSIDEDYTARVVIWNKADFLLNTVIERFDGDSVIGASFFRNTTEKILLVNDVGLILYDIPTDTMTVLDEEIHSENFEKAVFSPDGRWVALKKTHDDLYVIDLQNPFIPISSD